MGPVVSARDLRGLVAANATMGGVLWLVRDLPLAAKIAIAAVVFALATLLLGVVTWKFVRTISHRPKVSE
jgi:hypothetical protein